MLLNELYVRRNDETALRERADVGDDGAQRRLVDLHAGRGDVHWLRAHADRGDQHALMALADILADRGDETGLRELADAGHESANRRLADLLAERGDDQGLRELLANGCEHAAAPLAAVLVARGDRPPTNWIDKDSPWRPSTVRCRCRSNSVSSVRRTDTEDLLRRREEDITSRLIRTPLGVKGAAAGMKKEGVWWLVADPDASVDSIAEVIELVLFREWIHLTFAS
jgi:hypothetical protein